MPSTSHDLTPGDVVTYTVGRWTYRARVIEDRGRIGVGGRHVVRLELLDEEGGGMEVFQHPLRDSFGRTGIPLPGSTAVGDALAKHLGESGLSDLVAPRDLSRVAGLRMTDAVATGTTSLLLWGYGRTRGIESPSIRSAKLGILAHGLCSIAVAAVALVPALQAVVPYRSQVNYLSLAALTKNAVQLAQMTRRLRKGNLERFDVLERELGALQRMSAGEVPAEIDREIRLLTDATLNSHLVH